MLIKNYSRYSFVRADLVELFLMMDKKKSEYLLNKSSQGLVVDKMKWREMHDFSDDCVLMVLASDYYNEEDYIRNYDEFLKRS